MKKFLLGMLLGLLLAAPVWADSANSDIVAGNEAAMMENYPLAIELYSKAINSGTLANKQLSVAYNNRGCAYDDSGQSDKALQDFAKAISLDPAYDAPYFNRSFIYERQNQNAKAIADMEKAIRLDPNYEDYKIRLEWLREPKN